MLAASPLTLAACQGSGDTRYVEKAPVVKSNVDTNSTGTNPVENPEKDQYDITTHYFPEANRLDVVIKTKRNDVRILKVEYKDASDPNAKETDVELSNYSEVVYPLKTDSQDLRPWNVQFRITTELNSQIATVYQPKDFRVTTIMNMSTFKLGGNVLVLRNLDIGKNGILTIDLPSLTIEAQNIHAEEGSVIQNMSEETAGTAAPSLSRGKDGGRIEINTNNADGFLAIRLRGGKGGQGEAGKDIGPEGKGPKGNPGQNAEEGLYMPKGTWLCTKRPTDGGPGGKGAIGGDGHKGALGGNSGSIHFNTAKGTLKYDLQVTSGKGGDGGRPGIGGAAGDPGDPGRRGRYNRLCNIATNPGAPGTQGDPGSRGLDGDEGQLEYSCFRLKDDKTCSKETVIGELK